MGKVYIKTKKGKIFECYVSEQMNKPIYYPVDSKTNGYIDYYDVERFLEIDSMYREVEQLQQEKEAMKQLIEWIEECDFGFDNFVNDYEEDINMTEEEFDKETENMSYIESMIHYAKLYIKTKGE